LATRQAREKTTARPSVSQQTIRCRTAIVAGCERSNGDIDGDEADFGVAIGLNPANADFLANRANLRAGGEQSFEPG
jgi:hypothetical protein